MLCSNFSLANVTTPFSEAMLTADKVIKATIVKMSKDKVVFSVEKSFKGTVKGEFLLLTKNYYLEKAERGDTCFLLLDQNNKLFSNKLACGEHSILVLRKDKVLHGIYRYATKKVKFDYDKNDIDYDTFNQIEKALKSKLKAEE